MSGRGEDMLVSHRYRFIYTKTMKTGGTSVESYFERFCMPDGEWTQSHGREEYVSDAGIIGFRGRVRRSPASTGITCPRHSFGAGSEAMSGTRVQVLCHSKPYDKAVSTFFSTSRDKGASSGEGFPRRAALSVGAGQRHWLGEQARYIVDDVPGRGHPIPEPLADSK